MFATNGSGHLFGWDGSAWVPVSVDATGAVNVLGGGGGGGNVSIIGSIPLALDVATLLALETVSIAALPAVALDAVTLAALETISVANFPAKYPETDTAMTWVSVKSAAPIANSVQADTGSLSAGDYDFDVNLVCSDSIAAGKGMVIEHRNAANSATLHNLGGASPNGGAVQMRLRRYTIALNERIRVLSGTAAASASAMYVSAIGRRLS